MKVALPKGRLQEEASALFAISHGVDPGKGFGKSRRLEWSPKNTDLTFLSVRGSDVATYVEYGAADLGVVGLDILREREPDVYEPLDLGIGRCRLVLAVPADRATGGLEGLAAKGPVRIATHYPNIASRFLAGAGVPAAMIPLEGSIEIAPQLGIADAVVDITQSGETLRQNGLVVLEDVMEISARLIVNRVSLKLDPAAIREAVRALAAAVHMNA